MKKNILITIFLIFSNRVYSYPHMVGLGYTSCITCHYNPFGNGPLNDYGRALSATAVSAKWLNSKYKSEESLANESGFLFAKPENSWFRPSFDYRGLLIKKNLFEEGEETEFINMMADMNAVVIIDPKIHFSATVGYAPKPRALSDSTEDVENYRWREFYAGYRVSNSFGLYAGLMEKIYGLRVAEHTNYSRSITNLNQNDQAHGLQMHYSQPSYEFGLGAFFGNLTEKSDLRHVGFSAKGDYVISHKATLGGSVMKSSNDYVDITAFALHTKTSLGKGSAFLAEYGMVGKTPVGVGSSSSQSYALAQAYFNATRGFYIINSIEHLKFDDGSYLYRLGPGIQIFPAQRIEIKLELYNTRNFSEKSSTPDTWDFLGQTHIWF